MSTTPDDLELDRLAAHVGERLRAALQAAGHAQQLSITLGPVCDSPARRNAAAANARQRQAQEIVLGDPLVQALQRDYDGKIVPGSIQPL